jgi:hypothetical protein
MKLTNPDLDYCHYVYDIIGEDSRHYIGCRSHENPWEDPYMGSSTDKTFVPKEKHILCVFNTREEAAKFEYFLHKSLKVDVNPNFANRSISTRGGCSFSKGYRHTPEAVENIRKGNIGKNVGKVRSNDTKSLIGKQSKERWSDPEFKQRMKDSFSKRVVTEEGKQKRSESYQQRKEKGYRQPNGRKYLLLDPYGNQVEMYLSDVTEYGLQKSAICNLINHPEKHHYHKGWKVIGCVLPQ